MIAAGVSALVPDVVVAVVVVAVVVAVPFGMAVVVDRLNKARAINE